MKLIFIILAIFITIGCKSNYKSDGKSDSRKLFSHHDDTLIGEVLQTPIWSKKPVGVSVSPYGLLAAPAFSDGVVAIYDTTSGKLITSQFKMGKGPDEFIDPIEMGYKYGDSTFCVWDLGKLSINLYKVSEKGFSKIRSFQYNGINPSELRSVSDSTDVILTSIPNQSIILMDKNGTLDAIPYRVLNEPNLDYTRCYNSSGIDTSEKNKLLFIAASHLPFISCYSYAGNRIVKLWDKMVFKPDFEIANGWIKLNKEGFMGFDRIRVSDKFIYLSHQEITFSDWLEDKDKNLTQITLLIFDFDGNLVKTYLLDRNLELFTVTPDDRILYGTIKKPDYYIVKYHL